MLKWREITNVWKPTSTVLLMRVLRCGNTSFRWQSSNITLVIIPPWSLPLSKFNMDIPQTLWYIYQGFLYCPLSSRMVKRKKSYDSIGPTATGQSSASSETMGWSPLFWQKLWSRQFGRPEIVAICPIFLGQTDKSQAHIQVLWSLSCGAKSGQSSIQTGTPSLFIHPPSIPYMYLYSRKQLVQMFL